MSHTERQCPVQECTVEKQAVRSTEQNPVARVLLYDWGIYGKRDPNKALVFSALAVAKDKFKTLNLWAAK